MCDRTFQESNHSETVDLRGLSSIGHSDIHREKLGEFVLKHKTKVLQTDETKNKSRCLRTNKTSDFHLSIISESYFHQDASSMHGLN